MVNPKKFKGVRLRNSGSWVAEIRHPLLKKKVWLGTFDTAEEAARVHDQASIILSGRKAKTNFLFSDGYNDDNQQELEKQKGKPSSSSLSSSDKLSQVLHAKLKRTTKTPSPSLTCLRLDPNSALIGVWQKRACPISESKWVTSVKLGKSDRPMTHSRDNNNDYERVLEDSMLVVGSSNQEGAQTQGIDRDQMDEEERIALQMIEEMLSL